MPSSPSRRRFLAGAAGAAASITAGTCLPRFASARASAATDPILTFGLAADAQYADVEPSTSRFYREGAPRLAAAVEEFNREDLDFCVHLGDLIDRDWGSFDEIEKSLRHSRHAFHHVLGNHDFEVADARKAAVPGRLGLETRYHALSRHGFRFVFLDTTDISTYAHPEGSKESLAAEAELAKLRARKLPQAKPWNGAIGDEQLAWFESQCLQAQEAGERVIIFAHHPVFPEAGHNLWNASAILDRIEKCPAVAAWFNGHNHAGAFGLRYDVPFVTLQAMVETRDTTAYAFARVFEDRIELDGRGRDPSRTLKFRPAAAPVSR